MNLESFSLLTEFSIAIAGFSGVAIAIGRRGDVVEPVVWFRNLSMLVTAVCAAFASFIPHLATNFGASGPSLWRISSLGLLLVQVVVVAVPLVAARRLSSDERASLAIYMWAIVLAGVPTFALWQLANAFSFGGEPSAGPIVAGVVYLLFIAALLFVRMLARSPVRPAA